MKAGFVPAVGTPLDKNGNLCVESYKKQIEDQIANGAIAILSMGSMGIQPYMRTSVCPDVAKAAVEAAAGRVPVYVGAMDCSIARARERMAAMEDLDLAGFVLTTPYYYACTPQMILNYYKGACAGTKHKVLMYDLAVVTQSKITYDIVKELIRTVPNIAGIKSADLNMFRKLKLDLEVPEDFLMVYSVLIILISPISGALISAWMACLPARLKTAASCLRQWSRATMKALQSIWTISLRSVISSWQEICGLPSAQR